MVLGCVFCQTLRQVRTLLKFTDYSYCCDFIKILLHSVKIKKVTSALAAVAQWIRCQPANQRVAGSIPSQGTCLGCGPGPPVGANEKQPHIDVSLSPLHNVNEDHRWHARPSQGLQKKGMSRQQARDQRQQQWLLFSHCVQVSLTLSTAKLEEPLRIQSGCFWIPHGETTSSTT